MKKVSNLYETYNSAGDIYALFIELSQNILKPSGISSLIISNKWLRANYGESLRNYLVDKTNPIELIDFGQNLLFESAIVHTNIITAQKQENQNELSAVRIPDVFFKNDNVEFKSYVDIHKIENLKIDSAIWNIIPPNLKQLKNKVEKIGKKLIDWEVSINFGIKTGYNEAFIIDSATRTELISKDSKNEAIIKPILRGRDTRKYFCNYADLYMITLFPSLNLDIKNYPIIKEYLKLFLPKLNQTGEVFVNILGENEKTRKKTPNQWYEVQDSIAYHKEIEKNKIIFSEIVSEPQFYYDEKGYYPEATTFLLTGEKLKYLTALLNSKAVTFLFKSFYMGGELVGKI